jgi:hypothetical protein
MKVMVKRICFIFGLLASLTCAIAQRTGMQINPVTVLKTPLKASLSSVSFRGMPTKSSLELYCPTPGNQGEHGTCVAFANGYGIATILYAKRHNITDKSIIDKYTFSPTFLYEKIKAPTDNDCQEGGDPIQAVLTMIKEGDPLLKTLPYQCGSSINETVTKEAGLYKVKDAAVLFYKGTEYDKTSPEMISLTKKALLEGCPVSTGFHLPESFFKIKTNVWQTTPADTLSNWKHNGHAMAVVGYDDEKFGGSFRIMNSWGAQWADKGFIWIKYSDYTKWCVMALQVFGSDDSPVPPEVKKQEEKKPEENQVTVSLSGSVEFKLNTGESMSVNKTSTRNLTVEEDAQVKGDEELVAYTMSNTYTSGTKFRFFMTIDKEAYVYAFATDLSGKINRILPYDDLISTHVGPNSVIAFPSDTKVIKMDENKGVDYLLILYSREKLNMNEMLTIMNATKGSLSLKIKKVLGKKLADKNKINYYKDKIAFSINTKSTRNLTVSEDTPVSVDGSVIPLMIEIKHQ